MNVIIKCYYVINMGDMGWTARVNLCRMYGVSSCTYLICLYCVFNGTYWIYLMFVQFMYYTVYSFDLTGHCRTLCAIIGDVFRLHYCCVKKTVILTAYGLRCLSGFIALPLECGFNTKEGYALLFFKVNFTV